MGFLEIVPGPPLEPQAEIHWCPVPQARLMHWGTGSAPIGSGTTWKCDSCGEVWVYDAYSKKVGIYFWTLPFHFILTLSTLGLLGRSNGGWRRASFLKFWRWVNLGVYLVVGAGAISAPFLGQG